MESHKPLHGIDVGECGPKISFVATDNGYLKFTHFRQPRDSLLSRYVTISENGVFSHDPNSTKLAYGGMLNLRICLHFTSHYFLAKMATIAARYSMLRRQFESVEGAAGPEALVMQYQMQQLKVVPAIGAAWAHLITSNFLNSKYAQYTSELRKKPRDDNKAFGLLNDLHCIVAGLKPAGSWHVEHFGELLKQACGGHGYLQISGLTKPHLDFGVGVVTAEGDNNVLMQQTALILLKKVESGNINT